MLRSEFIERTGFEPTSSEYEQIEKEYMACDENKDDFCKNWKKNGGINRLSRLRARRIEELERELELTDKKLCKLQEASRSEVSGLQLKISSKNDEIERLRNSLDDTRNERDLAEDKLGEIKKAYKTLIDLLS